MSTETATWLNNETLIGYTEKRGKAWHYRAELQGEESNHYAGAIPVEDVQRRLFDRVTVLEGTVESTVITAEGVTRLEDKTSKSLWRAETGHRFGTFKHGFTVHDYKTWLLDNVATLLDADLHIGSAGLLKHGGVAWVQIEMEDTLQVEGFDYRPFFTAATSLDGSLSSTYQDGVQAVVCDNTLSAALGERTNRVKIKHSRNSIGRIGEVRDALGLILQTSKAFEEQVRTLIATEVTDKTWAAFLDAHVELPEKPGRGRTLAETKREQLGALYRHDERVAPWAGTAFGVLQAVNTFTHHVGTVRGATRQQRNAERAVLGGIDTLDLSTLETLNKVLVSA